MSENTRIVTPPFRVSFPHVFEKNQYGDNEPKYSIQMLWDPSKFTVKDKKAWKLIKERLNEVAEETFKKPYNKLPANVRKPLRDGAEKEHLEGYEEGMVFASASSKQQPGLIDRDKQDIISDSDFYAGCYARATITVFPYTEKGKGIAFGLQNIQKLGDGESLTGRVAAEDEDWGDDPEGVWDEDVIGDDDEDDILG